MSKKLRTALLVIAALFLTLVLALPNPAHALRPMMDKAGLEEVLTREDNPDNPYKSPRLLQEQPKPDVILEDDTVSAVAWRIGLVGVAAALVGAVALYRMVAPILPSAGLEETQFSHRFNMPASADRGVLMGIINESLRRFRGVRQSPLFGPGSTLVLEEHEDELGIHVSVRDRHSKEFGDGRAILLGEAVDNAVDAILDRAQEQRGDVAGEISIHAGLTGEGNWYLEVRDNGMGILRGRLETLFHEPGSSKPGRQSERRRAGGVGRAIAAEMNYGNLLMAGYEGVIQVDSRRPGETGSRLLAYDPRTRVSSVRTGARAEAGTTVRWVFGVDPIVDPRASTGLEEYDAHERYLAEQAEVVGDFQIELNSEGGVQQITGEGGWRWTQQVFSQREDDLGMRLLAYRPSTEGDAALLLVNPKSGEFELVSAAGVSTKVTPKVGEVTSQVRGDIQALLSRVAEAGGTASFSLQSTETLPPAPLEFVGNTGDSPDDEDAVNVYVSPPEYDEAPGVVRITPKDGEETFRIVAQRSGRWMMSRIPAAGMEEGGIFWADAEDFVRRNPEQASRLPHGTSHLLVLRGDSSIHLYRPGTLAEDVKKVVEDGIRELAEGGADLKGRIRQEGVPLRAEALKTPGFFVWDRMLGDPLYPVRLPRLDHYKGGPFPFGLRKILAIAIFNSFDAPSVRLLSAWTYEEDGVPVFVLAVQA